MVPLNELVRTGCDRCHASEEDGVILVDLAFPLAVNVALLEVLPWLHMCELGTDGRGCINAMSNVAQALPVLFLLELVCPRGKDAVAHGESPVHRAGGSSFTGACSGVRWRAAACGGVWRRAVACGVWCRRPYTP